MISIVLDVGKYRKAHLPNLKAGCFLVTAGYLVQPPLPFCPMPKKWKLPVIFGVMAFLALGWKAFRDHENRSASAVEPHTKSGDFTLVRIIDGDSIVVDNGNGPIKVRLIGIDCPERNQPYGTDATRALKNFLGDSPLRVQGQKKDRWGRLLAHVYVESQLINLQLVKEGAAWVYRAEQDTFWADLNEAEREARQEKRGLWALPDPIYPGDWRKRK